jgi:hypothetical protein
LHENIVQAFARRLEVQLREQDASCSRSSRGTAWNVDAISFSNDWVASLMLA